MAILFLGGLREAAAINASPQPVEVTQADGSVVKLHIRGDESFNWFEDEAGYTVVRQRGEYFYGRLDAAGKLVGDCGCAVASDFMGVGSIGRCFAGSAGTSKIPSEASLRRSKMARTEFLVKSPDNSMASTVTVLISPGLPDLEATGAGREPK